MALVKKGPAMGFSGAVDGLIYYQQSDGTTTVAKEAVRSSKPPTILQLSTQQDTRVCAELLKSITDFINVGFELQAKLEKLNQNNSAVRYIRHNAITGTYPDRRIDYARLLVTCGKMETPQNAAVTLTETGFSFTWDAEIKKGSHHSDQIMLMAYFPELKKAVYLTAGAQRFKGTDMLMLSGVKHGYAAEIYISFISDNRKAISNSIHLGQLTW